jgi:hypothetical protein
VRYRINRRPTSQRPLSERWRMINRARSRTRARGKHAFRVVKQLWGLAKVRYRGLAKNLARAQTMFALANTRCAESCSQQGPGVRCEETSGSKQSLWRPSPPTITRSPFFEAACHDYFSHSLYTTTCASLLDSALSTLHSDPLSVESTFGVSWFAHSLQPAELLASLADLTRFFFFSVWPTEAFTSELSAESVALLAVGYFYSGIWAPPLAGLAPAGTAASFAARGSETRTLRRSP